MLLVLVLQEYCHFSLQWPRQRRLSLLPALASPLVRLSSSLTSAPSVFQPGVFLPLVDPLVDPQRGGAGEGSRGWYLEMKKEGEMEMEPSAGTEIFVSKKSTGRRLEKWCTILRGFQLLGFTTTQVNWHSCVETRLKPCKHGYWQLSSGSWCLSCRTSLHIELSLSTGQPKISNRLKAITNLSHTWLCLKRRHLHYNSSLMV